jgi:hypothetical protein
MEVEAVEIVVKVQSNYKIVNFRSPMEAVKFDLVFDSFYSAVPI